MRKLPQSVPISYRDIDKSISLKCYADTIVFLKENNRRTLAAVRFGGYPEQVRGMSDAMYGGISFEAEFEQGRAVIYSEKKRYRRKTSHDGIYAETVLVMLDDERNNTTENEDEKENTKQRQFIFCKANDKDTLFSEIDKKVSIPLISEFKDFIIDELLKSKILVPLEVFSIEQSFDAYMLCMKNDESDVIEIVNRGLRQGEISIPNSHLSQDNFDNINSVSQYLNKYGTVIAERIKDSFLPLYDPANEDVCDSLKRINAHLKNHTGYELYSAQLAVAEAVKRRLENAKTAMVIAECGSGKTKIGSAALASYQNGQKCFNVVLSPSHVTHKWVREIYETLPNTKAVVVHNITELMKVYKDFEENDMTVYVILSKERARDGYMKRPAVKYSVSKRGYVCPDCGETVETELSDDSEYNNNSRCKKRKIRERQLPGVSPLVYSRFLIESAVFLSLNDMGKNLPDYEEIPVELSLHPDVMEEYKRIEDTLIRVLRKDKAIARKVMSQYLQLTSTYPDQPYAHKPILHPKDGEPIIIPKDTMTADDLNDKDFAVLDIVERKVGNGERVLIYTNWVKLDTQDKLKKLLTEKGYKTEILRVNIPPDKREKWVEDKVKDGVNVVITNPALVETGLDLNAFTTLVYYNVGYNLFTFRQSSRRSWRINQTAPRIEVYMLYYKGVMQERALKLMASKLSVATIIEGNLSDEGLAAMSECRDMTTLLAKELTLGIKSEIDDLSQAFRKMAVIHEKPKMKNANDTNVKSNDVAKVKKTVEISAIAAFSGKKKGKKVEYENPNQISIFDLLAG